MGDYKLAILNAIKIVYEEAKQKKENLQFFKDLNFICSQSAEWADIGNQRLVEGKSHDLREDFGLANDKCC